MVRNSHSMILRAFMALLLSAVLLSVGPASLHALTLDEERRVGKELYDSIKEAGLLLEDEDLNAYVNEIGARLVAQDDRYPLPFTFSVIRNSGINAFATPGGYIYLFTGLIKLAEDESQLAGVLAHEIAHVKARHVAQMIARQKKQTIATLAATLAGAFLGGGEGAAIASGLATATSATLSLKYSREHEEEADRLGMAYLTGAGYNGQSMLDFLKIMRFNQFYSSRIPSYFLTHPETSERIRYLTLLLQTRYQPGGETEILGGLERFQTRLHLDLQNPRDNIRTFSERLSRNPDDVEARYGLAVSESKTGRGASSRENFLQALEMRPGDWEIRRDFGISLFEQGDVSRAADVLQDAAAVNGSDPTLLFYLGRSHETLHDYPAALDTFRKLNELDPDHREAYYHLAMVYGKTGKTAESHYYFGKYFKRSGRTQSALFHFRTALEHVPDDSPMARDIREEMQSMGS